MNGPAPTKAEPVELRETIGRWYEAIHSGSIDTGDFMMIRTVRSSGVSTTAPVNCALKCAVDFSAAICSMVHLTSADESFCPLWNVASRSLNSQPVSPTWRHESASSGRTAPSGPYEVRPR